MKLRRYTSLGIITIFTLTLLTSCMAALPVVVAVTQDNPSPVNPQRAYIPAPIPRPDAHHWITATAAILNYENRSDHRTFDVSWDAMTRVQTKWGLNNSWNIRTADDLRNQISRMETGGGHSRRFMEEVFAYQNLLYLYGEDHVLDFIAAQEGEAAAITAAHTLYLADKWGDTGIIGWDLFRVGTLVSFGYVAELIDAEEASLLMEQTIAMLVHYFTNWDDAVENYLDGFSWWASIDITSPGNQFLSRHEIYRQLQDIDGLFDDLMFGVR